MPCTTSLDPGEMRGLGARLEDLSVQLTELDGPIGGSAGSLGSFGLVEASVWVRGDVRKRAVEVAGQIERVSEAVHETTVSFEASDGASGQAFERSAADVYGSADRED